MHHTIYSKTKRPFWVCRKHCVRSLSLSKIAQRLANRKQSPRWFWRNGRPQCGTSQALRRQSTVNNAPRRRLL